MKTPRLPPAKIAELFASGAVKKNKFFVARLLANALPHSRFAPLVGKKTGTAVERNRIKRRLRAAWITLHTTAPHGWDFVLIGNRQILTAPFTELTRQFASILTEAKK
jgi:ribonuclease P protein component